MKKVLSIIALISFVNIMGQTTVGNDFIIPNGKLQIGSNSNNGSPGAKIEALSRYSSNQDEEIRIGFKKSGDLNFYGLGLNYRTNNLGTPSHHLVSYLNGVRRDILTFSNTGHLGISTNGAERMRISNTGNVGIGTTNPLRMLDVYVPHQINANEAIRIGSFNSTNYNGIGLNYRIDANGVPANYLVSFVNNKTHNMLTYTPDYLAFSTNLTEKMRILNNGYVGIGTTSPNSRLEVVVGHAANRDEEFRMGSYNSLKNFFGMGMNYRLGPTGTPSYHLVNYYSNVRRTVMTFTKDGKVGIGTEDTFGYTLAVNGIIGAKEVRVEISSAWPDYVFAKDYKLPSLENLENQIKECGHLPNIPSAKEVQQEGIALGEMNVKLLEKIEELTLYAIDQQKKIKEQEARLVKLEELLLKK